eukprot:COSAG05_NODE_3980_length_1741_cov_1.498173_1_plen_300_part_00
MTSALRRRLEQQAMKRLSVLEPPPAAAALQDENKVPNACTAGATVRTTKLRRPLGESIQGRDQVSADNVAAEATENLTTGLTLAALLERRRSGAPGAIEATLRAASAACSSDEEADEAADDAMEMTAAYGRGVVGRGAAKLPATPAVVGSQPPATPQLVTPAMATRSLGGTAAQGKATKRVNVGVAGETPLQVNVVEMTPNEERKKRTWQPNKYGAALALLEEAADEEIDSARAGAWPLLVQLPHSPSLTCAAQQRVQPLAAQGSPARPLCPPARTTSDTAASTRAHHLLHLSPTATRS